MMQRDMFRKHYNQTMSLEEIQQIMQQRELARQEQAKQLDQLRNLLILKNYLHKSAEPPVVDDGHTTILSKSRNMFSKHFFPKPCDSCYASRASNQKQMTEYELAMEQYKNSRKLATNSQILGIPPPRPIRPRQMPLVVDLNGDDSI